VHQARETSKAARTEVRNRIVNANGNKAAA